MPQAKAAKDAKGKKWGTPFAIGLLTENSEESKEKGRTTGPAFSHTLHLRTSAATTT